MKYSVINLKWLGKLERDLLLFAYIIVSERATKTAETIETELKYIHNAINKEQPKLTVLLTPQG